MILIFIWRIIALVSLLVLLGMAGACILYGYDYDGWWALTVTAFLGSGARLLWLDLVGYDA